MKKLNIEHFVALFFIVSVLMIAAIVAQQLFYDPGVSLEKYEAEPHSQKASATTEKSNAIQFIKDREEEKERIRLEEVARQEEEERLRIAKEREEMIKNSPKKAYITIDDGPSKYTDGIIKTLNDHKVPGTFFFIGGSLKILSDASIKSLKDNGHSLGAHSMSHDKVKIYDQKLFVAENKQTFDLIHRLGFESNIVRAPYGSTYLSDGQIKDIRSQGWVLLDWHIDSLDWKFRNTNKTYNHIISQIPGVEKKGITDIIILLHEKPETVPILNKLIPELKNRGYTIVSGEQVPFKELIFKGR